MKNEEKLSMFMKEISELENVENVTVLRTEGFYEKEESTSKENDINSPSCWGTLQNDEYVAAFKSVDKVPSGIYEIVWNRSVNQHTLKKQPFKTDELYQLPSYEIQDILKDIQNFWDRKDK